MPAFKEAIKQGAEGLVVDVSATEDGTMIAGNDRLIRALALGARRVDHLDWATLRQADLAPVFGGPSPLRISPLDEILAVFLPTTPIILRVSQRRTSLLLRDWLDSRPVPLENLALMSGNLRTLELMKLPVRRYFAPSSATVRRSDTIDGLAWPTLGLSSLPQPDASRRLRLVGLECDSGASANMALDYRCDLVLTERPAWLHQRFASLIPHRRPLPWTTPQPRTA